MTHDLYTSWAWRKLRPLILRRDGYRCQVPQADGSKCGRTDYPRESMPVDHIIPIADGGEALDPRNLRASCLDCNSRRPSNTHVRTQSKEW